MYLLSLLFSVSLNKIKSYEIITTYCWVYKIFSCSMYNNNSTKKGEEGIELYRNKISVSHWN